MRASGASRSQRRRRLVAAFGRVSRHKWAESADADATDELSLAALSISELSLTERLPFDLLESILCHADPPAVCAAGGACRVLRHAAHAEAVMTSEGWQQLGTQPNLLQELFAHKAGVRKRPEPAAAGDGQPASKRRRAANGGTADSPISLSQ